VTARSPHSETRLSGSNDCTCFLLTVENWPFFGVDRIMLTLCQYLQNVSVIEIKSAQTISPEAMRPIANIRRALGERISGATLVFTAEMNARIAAGFPLSVST
jgi:hypothetical protein